MKANDGISIPRMSDEYPRPQLFRPGWLSLNGPWSFALDPTDCGVSQEWFNDDPLRTEVFIHSIAVPFPPGSELSGVLTDAPESVPDVVWYSRTLTPDELQAAGEGDELFLNFEAVDFSTDVWVDGQHRGHHRGGYTPFSIPVGPKENQPKRITIRAEDSRFDASQPRGKQTWRAQPNGIWYHRSTGIWRDVWLEAVPKHHIVNLHWETDLSRGILHGQVHFSQPVPPSAKLHIKLSRSSEVIANLSQSVSGTEVQVQFSLPQLLNRMDWDDWLWAPKHPNLFDLELDLECGEEHDLVYSYVGLRTVELSNRYLSLNRTPIFIRGILDQGYWDESFFTAPSPQAIRNEVELILSLGFNLSRVHERTPDRRYLAWADRMGLLVWGESASAYSFSELSAKITLDEWHEIVLRDRAAPSIVAWVPFNESWGVPEIASDPRQRALVESVVALTKFLDQTRPIIANDGWEQLDTDLVTTHDYGTSREELAVNYKDVEAVAETVNGVGPQGRKILLDQKWVDDRPVLVSEFGGISLRPQTNLEGKHERASSDWGYGSVGSAAEFEERLESLFDALLSSPVLGGFCYTQLTDTMQEANGLCTPDRSPKIPAEVIHRIVTAEGAHRSQTRPRNITTEAVSPRKSKP